LSAYVEVNGLKAYTLFDSGSTTVSITPDFARVSKIPLIQLENPVVLQLGCVGSRSKINFGANVNLKFGPVDAPTYVDIVNIDRYDMIIGTPFLRKHGVNLDFEHQVVRIRGAPIPVLSEGEES
ncbi:hypothetical protein BV25DRAFT_1769138, partial [Artomyces pyxidatus]